MNTTGKPYTVGETIVVDDLGERVTAEVVRVSSASVDFALDGAVWRYWGNEPEPTLANARLIRSA